MLKLYEPLYSLVDKNKLFSDLCGLDHQIVVASLLSAWLGYNELGLYS